MKKVIVVVVILLLVFILSAAKDMLIKSVVQRGVHMVTGLRLSMGSFKVGLFNNTVSIRDLKLFNPKGYAQRLMLEMPEIYIDCNWPAFFKRKVYVENLRINLKKFTVVKNEDGQLNLDALKVVKAQKEGKRPEEKEEKKMPPLQIDSLDLKIGKVTYMDFSKIAVSVREFDINLNERYENIDSPYKLVSLIVVRALMNTSIAALTNFDLRGLEGTVSDTLSSVKKIAAESVEKAQKTFEETAQKAQQAAEETRKAAQELEQKVKEATEGLKDFKLPFQEEE